MNVSCIMRFVMYIIIASLNFQYISLQNVIVWSFETYVWILYKLQASIERPAICALQSWSDSIFGTVVLYDFLPLALTPIKPFKYVYPL